MANLRVAALRVAPLALGVGGLVMLLLAARSFLGSAGFAYDFAAYDEAARRLAAGEELYPPGIAAAYNSGSYEGLYLYPPPLAVALIPLTALTADAAAMAWLGLRFAILVVGIALLPVSTLARGATLLVAGLSFPVWYDLNLGNLSIVVFALSAAIWRFRERPLGAVALAAAGILRYSFAIVLVSWILQRRWRAVAWTIGGGVVIGALTLPVVGLSGWLDYVGVVTGLRDVSSGPHNLNLATTAAALGLPGPSAAWVLAGMAVALVATAFAALRRDLETATVVALAATTSFFPFFHPHYLVQLIIPAAFLVGRGHWWALGMPLLGWLPGEVLPVVSVVAILTPLLPPLRRGRVVSVGDELAGATGGFGTGPTRP